MTYSLILIILTVHVVSTFIMYHFISKKMTRFEMFLGVSQGIAPEEIEKEIPIPAVTSISYHFSDSELARMEREEEEKARQKPGKEHRRELIRKHFIEEGNENETQ